MKMTVRRVVTRIRRAAEQLASLAYETRQLTGGKWWRWASVWFTDTFWVLASYRLSRGSFLLLGRGWSALRVVASPLLFALRPWSGRCEINYRADIDRGLRVLHPTLGVVVSGKTIAGKYLVLVGGNCIGGRKALDQGDIRIGDNVLLGANACVMGPLQIGDNARIGAAALVVSDVAADAVLLAPTAQPRPTPSRQDP
jgi:serine acetyltransferase